MQDAYSHYLLHEGRNGRNVTQEDAMRVRTEWGKRQRGESERQVKCLTASRGHMWMRNHFDRLPAVVRRRLAESEFNICAACMDIEAYEIAKGTPSIKTYLRVIDAIERKLAGHNDTTKVSVV
jgi:hypothetical protein